MDGKTNRPILKYPAVEYEKLVPQIQDDLTKFQLITSLAEFRISKDLNIKRIFYRSISLFVSALGRAHGLRQNSSFAIIKELKRKDVITTATAHRLSLAVAVACHTRLVYYSSKKSQEDVIYKEEATIGGEEKLKELKKIVNIQWLVKGLVTSMALQEVLQASIKVQDFDFFLRTQGVLLTSTVMLYLGMHCELIRSGERFFSEQSELTIFDHMAITDICGAYRTTRQYDKCLDLIGRFRKKFPKRPTKLDPLFNKGREKFGHFEEFTKGMNAYSTLCTDVEDHILLLEANCLVDLRKYPLALRKTDELLKSNIGEVTRVMVLLSNSMCKLKLKEYREGLSGLRDHLKLNNVWNHKSNSSSNYVTTPQTFQYIAIGLILIGRKEQGLHWALEGLHYVTVTKAVSLYTQQLHLLIKTAKILPFRQFEMMFLGRENYFRFASSASCS